MAPNDDAAELREQADKRREVEDLIVQTYAPEDDVLRETVAAGIAAGLPTIHISPMEGQLLSVLAAACGAKRILEIGALAGYSGTWLARALPADGRLISLDVDPHHAEVARAAFARAGVADRAEVRVGPGTELLPALASEAPFDMVFIDANKDDYPAYLDWALRLTRPGSIIVADNVVRNYGEPLRPPSDTASEDMKALHTYNRRVASDPRLRSIALPIDDQGRDGVAISVVLATTPS